MSWSAIVLPGYLPGIVSFDVLWAQLVVGYAAAERLERELNARPQLDEAM